MLSKLIPNYVLHDHDVVGKVIRDSNQQLQISPRPSETLKLCVPEVMHNYRYKTEEDGYKVPRTTWSDLYARKNIRVSNLNARTKLVNAEESCSKSIFSTSLYRQNYISFTASKDANWDGVDIVTKSNGRITKRELPTDLNMKCTFIGGISSHGITSLADRDLDDGTYNIEGTDDTSLNTSFIYSGDMKHKEFHKCTCVNCSACELPQLSQHLDDLITLLMDNKIIGEMT